MLRRHGVALDVLGRRHRWRIGPARRLGACCSLSIRPNASTTSTRSPRSSSPPWARVFPDSSGGWGVARGHERRGQGSRAAPTPVPTSKRGSGPFAGRFRSRMGLSPKALQTQGLHSSRLNPAACHGVQQMATHLAPRLADAWTRSDARRRVRKSMPPSGSPPSARVRPRSENIVRSKDPRQPLSTTAS